VSEVASERMLRNLGAAGAGLELDERGRFQPKEWTPEEEARAKAAIEERERRERQEQQERLRESLSQSGMLGYAVARLDDEVVARIERHAPEVVKRCRAYAAGNGWQRGQGLTISGPMGHGKTYLACATAAEMALQHRLRIRFINCLDFTDEMEGFGRNKKLLRQLQTCPLLVLDDVGIQLADWQTPETQKALTRLIEHRYRAWLPTVVTTNLPSVDKHAPMDFLRFVGPKVKDRLDERNQGMRLEGKSLRHGGGEA